jgi:hypothetical protein
MNIPTFVLKSEKICAFYPVFLANYYPLCYTRGDREDIISRGHGGVFGGEKRCC